MKIIAKIAFFLLVVVVIGTANNYVINGPLLQHNADLSVRQFGSNSATAGDLQIAGYWVSFNTLYVIEVLFIALVGIVLFLRHITNLVFCGKN